MTLSSLSSDARAVIEQCRWDRIIEKHEGPDDWESTLRHLDPEFMRIGDYAVLLPVDRSHHPNITIRRCIPSADDRVLTIFLEDTTYFDGMFAGFMAVCERVLDEDFFLATVYHEWFAFENEALRDEPAG